MFKEYFMILVLGHVLGDYYFQSNKMAERKDRKFGWIILHCLCYFLIMSIICFLTFSLEFINASIIASGLHLVIDMFKYFYVKTILRKNKATQAKERTIFLIDQFLHIASLIGITYWLIINDTAINENRQIRKFFTTIGISEEKILAWTLTLLLIHKPANIFIQKMISLYKPFNTDEESQNGKNGVNVGKFIGTVERIIILIFIAIEQYSAIGLVLTAKSIARYDRISRERDFAEYYLLGTLISTACAIVCSFII